MSLVSPNLGGISVIYLKENEGLQVHLHMRLNHMDPSNDIKRALMFGHISDLYEYYNFPSPMCYYCFISDSYIVYDI